jgi:hypothetical protein
MYERLIQVPSPLSPLTSHLTSHVLLPLTLDLHPSRWSRLGWTPRRPCTKASAGVSLMIFLFPPPHEPTQVREHPTTACPHPKVLAWLRDGPEYVSF